MNSVPSTEVNFSRISPLLYETTLQIAQRVANIQLRLDDTTVYLNSDPCTVYTTTKGAYQIRFVFCAELNFLRRTAENMLGEPASDFEEIEESAKEFFNILCGHIVGEISRRYRINATFLPPSFIRGQKREPPSQGACQDSLHLISSQNERICLCCNEDSPPAYAD